MSENANSRPPPPLWIDADFITKALKQGNGDADLYVEAMTIDYACREGAGYASLVFRVNATVKKGPSAVREDKTVVVKIAQESGAIKEVFDKLGAFQVESLFLSDAMTQIHKILKSIEGDCFQPLTAQCFSYGREPREFIVLEDLVALGFRLAEAGKPLDWDHCLLAFRSYGRLHGASAFLLKDQPKYAEMFGSDCYADESAIKFFSQIGDKLFIAAAEQLEKCPGFERSAERFLEMANTSVELFAEAIKRKTADNKLSVLNHGDCWKNNAMFKYAGGVTDIRFVDFQVTCANNPARDLVYFLYANASEEVHRYYVERLLTEYHSTLIGTLRALGLNEAADEYPLDQLKTDMDDLGIMGLVYATMSSFFLASERMAGELAKTFDNPDIIVETIRRCYDNPYSVSYLKYVTNHFENKGLI